MPMIIPAIMAAMAAQEAVSCPMRMSTTTRPMPINDATWDQVRWLGVKRSLFMGIRPRKNPSRRARIPAPMMMA